MTEPNKPHEPMSAQERLDLGESYFKEDKFDEAIKPLSSIRREEAAPEIYAQAQLVLGAVYYAQEDLEQAIETWSNIRREEAAPEIYAQAQLNIGAAYYAQGKLEQAIEAWSSIHHDDDPETYAQAQLGLGAAYNESSKLDQAIKTWSNIRREEAEPETYARAQLGLGAAYYAQSELEQAIEAWSNISRDDDPKAYARAQLGLGIVYKDQNELDQANIEVTHIDQGKLEQAIEAWSNISHDDPKAYAQAQLNIGNAYYAQKKTEQAIKTWASINREEADPETYIEAQLGLGEVYSLDEDKKKQAHEAYNNVRDFSYYKSERGFKILNCPLEVREDLHSLAKNTDEILKSLQIIPEFESKVAHYSRALTAFKLFKCEKNKQKPSKLRLNTIRGVNDPTEGLVLSNYWDQQGIPETTHTNNTATFVSCFTFNHDSLNQFRLYGKEDDREATGVSLVFNKEFFSEHSGALKYIASALSNPSNKPRGIDPNETGKPESDNKEKLIDKSALYRCIYLDPKTGYWTLAQRDKSTFYRQYKKKTEKKWEKYYKLTLIKEKKVEKHLFSKENNDNNSVGNENSKIKSISQILNSIFTDKSHSYNNCDKNEKQKILEAVRFILLPLQYLVKHIAFQEEQECRIMYTTHLHDEKIHHDWEKQWMYVEYNACVRDHIDKIYLSPGAAKYQDHFRILLDQDGNKSKVRISQNPFRNKE